MCFLLHQRGENLNLWSRFEVVGMPGFEPRPSGPQRAAWLRHIPRRAEAGTRTRGLLPTMQALFQLSYIGRDLHSGDSDPVASEPFPPA